MVLSGSLNFFDSRNSIFTGRLYLSYFKINCFIHAYKRVIFPREHRSFIYLRNETETRVRYFTYEICF